ncbi:Lactonase, 7-bladed beta-propeller-domain-containing protein [Lasiosphaeria ovina]|uniref:Lactonase, 7-bladed beta-propeller-domain-containing protein n=1 Tax=Lasiosphaeria ovina TaxID=92902 RepID=A0AAE0N9W2_9PEZI|nr:Lactonase, 7-bladed beta-propeller-domain-containing protein [Lasiosphaeria ovina]
MTPKGLLSLLLAAPASAEILFATSYNDHALYTLSLNASSLAVVAKSYDCGSEPTWLTLDYAKSVLYCLNEGWGGAASITSYKTTGGALTKLDVLPVLKSPVASTLFGPNKTELAVAYYDTSSFITFSVADPSKLALQQQETYKLASPGPVPDRQDVPHIHDAILDPTGQYLVATDLGADLLHIYKISNDAKNVTELTPVKAVPGSGPRHGAFATAGKNTYFYNVNELSNTITGYSVSYDNKTGPAFTRLFDFSTHGPGGTVPAGTKAAELVISPDQKFVILSSRGESSLTIPNFDAGNSTALPSDPLVSFAIDGATGALKLAQVAPAGGVNPRGFSLNKAGTLVASALQDDNRVVVIARDPVTGLLGNIVAHAVVGVGAGNGPNYALFNE